MSSRRKFLRNGFFFSAFWSFLPGMRGSRGHSPTPAVVGQPMVVSTWDFGMAANQVAMDRLKDGASAVDAVEAGVRVSEADPRITSVGKGGFPDAEGDVTLDACIMDHQARCGAVAALENTLHPVSVARAVMERTPHILLVGQKAVDFARRLGFPKEDLLTREARGAWKEWRKGNPRWRDFSTDISNHDTIGMLAMDARGNLSGACTTSGWAFKVPGRVGDSPIIGAGLFVDNEVGAATATGTGEEVIRISGAFLIVELMRNGYSPLEACQEAVRRVRKNNPDHKDLFVGFLALNKHGEFGAWATKPGFEYAVTSLTGHRLETSGY